MPIFHCDIPPYMGKNIYIPGRKFLLLSTEIPTFLYWELYHITLALKGTQKPSNQPAFPILKRPLLSATLSWPILEKGQWQGTHYLSGNIFLVTTLTGRKLFFILRSKSVFMVSNMWQLASLQQHLHNKIPLFLWCIYFWSLATAGHTGLTYFRISFSISGQTLLIYSAIPCDILLNLGHSFVNCFHLRISILERKVTRCMEKPWPL